LPRTVAWPLTFLAVVCGWVLFRASDFSSALTILAGMAGMNGVSLPASLVTAMGMPAGGVFNGVLAGFEVDGGAPRLAAFVLAGSSIAFFAPNSQQIARYATDRTRTIALPSLRLAPAAGALLALGIMALGQVSSFLYYQF